MHPPLLLLALLAAAPAPPERAPAESVLAAPARCVLRHLGALRLAGARAAAPRESSPGASRRVLESFQLLAARSGPRGAAIVTVIERFSRPKEPRLEVAVAEYVVARIGGEWTIVQLREAG